MSDSFLAAAVPHGGQPCKNRPNSRVLQDFRVTHSGPVLEGLAQ